ncbi:hypothetical protein HYU18_04540 [Candidatus Woesearchaeota archaeon]|nr:hypothetical protein [Candidatus Woesearchaeota archaeon]
MTEDGIENTVKDHYIVHAQKKEEEGINASQAYQSLVQRVEQLQQEYGLEKFTVHRRFEYVKAVAVVIRDQSLVELLEKEGYPVEKQKPMGLERDSKNL